MELIHRWLATYKAGTVRSYKHVIWDFIAHFDETSLRTVQTDDIQRYFNSVDVPSKFLSRRRLTVLRSFYQFGVGQGYFTTNPAASLHNEREVDRLPPKTISENDILKMLRATEDDREFIILGLIYYAALSTIEIAALTWDDLLPSQNLRITLAPYQRTVPIPLSLWNRIINFSNIQTPDDPVFPSRVGGGLTARQLNRIVRAISERSGIDANPNTIRNSHAQHALTRGARLQDVQKIMRHRTIRTTVRHQKTKDDAPAEMISASFLPKV